MLPSVCVIILNWNGKEDTIGCLESLSKITYINYNVLLVDNGSTDGSVALIKEMYPSLEIIENFRNLGFAEGNNIGILRALEKKSEYVLLLNNDTIVDPEFLSKMVEAAEKSSDIGVVGPTVYYYNTNKIQSAGVKINWNTGHHKVLRLNSIEDDKSIKTESVDYVSGCALLAKATVLQKIGYLNQHYFAYWEETDLCVRAIKAGYNVVCVPMSKVWHKGGSTSSKTNGFYEYHINRNMFWFMKRHATKNQYFTFLLYFFAIRFFFRGFLLFYNKNILGFKLYCKGIFDGLSSYN